MNLEQSTSVDEILNKLSLLSVSVPRFDTSGDVFDFINEFEMATVMLPDDQKIKLLVKAFPAGRLMAWYETQLKPMISWSAIKQKLIERYSDTEDRDRHFQRLNELKFVERGKRLYDFIDDLLYSFGKAFPEVGDDSRIRFVKSRLPQTVKSQLVSIMDYNKPKNLDAFLQAIRQYDTQRSAHQDAKKDCGKSISTSEVVDLLKEIANGVRQEREVTRSIVAALKPDTPA